ncbi:hypothetical protein AB1Y20_020335 [Prymnesium parvum]|uniref:Ubiquinol-cytochrome C reductase hinge domain-containing protein n=1 Tax=Prymnesium parvum TaxID=97485 RepID=A0AB34JTB6_PRYPA
MAEPRYGGAYVPIDLCTDPKPDVDRKCAPGCSAAWEKYQACATRIEEKGSGECSGYYMDYFKCVDKCTAKSLFSQLA